MASKKARELERDEYRAKLREAIPIGSTVYTLCFNVSRSGMSRHVRVFVMRARDWGKGKQTVEPWDCTGWVAKAIGERWNDRTGGLVVSGCGMDMGFHVVQTLSYALHGTGEGKRCAKHRKETATATYQVRPCAESRDSTPEQAAKCYRTGYTLHHAHL